MWERQFDVQAKVAPGATRKQFLLMLQNLLKERFMLASHFEDRRISGYQLTIAKNGPKLKESGDEPEPPFVPGTGSDGFPNNAGVTTLGSRFKLKEFKETMDRLSVTLTQELHKPVADATGLTGKYIVLYYWADNLNSPEAESGPMIFAALQSQLGLKLEPASVPVSLFVVDHMEKAPTEN
jgi:uncharacterized protein (TIGR03435 family)